MKTKEPCLLAGWYGSGASKGEKCEQARNVVDDDDDDRDRGDDDDDGYFYTRVLMESHSQSSGVLFRTIKFLTALC